MKFSRAGITRNFYNDSFTWHWPFQRKNGKYFSATYGLYFNSVKDYWQHVGSVSQKMLQDNAKLDSYSLEEVLSKWAISLYSTSAFIILYNLNVSAKDIAFWARIPHSTLQHLSHDVVIMRCSDKREVYSLLESTPTEFANAIGFCNGLRLSSNWEMEKAE